MTLSKNPGGEAGEEDGFEGGRKDSLAEMALASFLHYARKYPRSY